MKCLGFYSTTPHLDYSLIGKRVISSVCSPEDSLNHTNNSLNNSQKKSQDNPLIRDVSDTAFWVAFYRSQESERPDALFNDRFAKKLVDARAEKIAKHLDKSSPHTRHNVVIRTVIIDRFIEKLIADGVDAVVNLGAGLDSRPFRMKFSKNIHWIEIDYPHVINYKKEKLKDSSPQVSLEQIALDLSVRHDRQRIFTEIANKFNSVLVITEGVLPYLTEDQVSELSEDLMMVPNFKFWITDYIAAHVYKYIQTKDRKKKMINAPFQFFPKDWMGFFSSRNWMVHDIQYIGEEAEKLNRRMKLPWLYRAILPFLSENSKQGYLKGAGYMILKKTQ